MDHHRKRRSKSERDKQRHGEASYKVPVIGNEIVPEIIINDTINFFLKVQSEFW